MDIYERVKKFYEKAKTEKYTIGKSIFGRNLYAVKVGEGAPVGVAQYAMHGREYITSQLAFAHFAKGVSKGSCWILPLVNPDGALLSEIGLSTAPTSQHAQLLAWNQGADFSLWKANGRGVDLNVNFPAKWGKGSKNSFQAGRENYVGERPFSEPETLALKKFTEKIKPDFTLSYHTKGEEIYWYFYQSLHTCPLHKSLAMEISDVTGYPLAYAKNSVGGYKDWCIQRFQIPSFTIEVGKDTLAHPLRENALPDIVEKNIEVIDRLVRKL